MLLSFGMSYAQIKVVAPNGDVGIGTSSPGEKLDVDGDVKIRGLDLSIGSNANTFNDEVALQLGDGRGADGKVSFQLISDVTAYPDWGFRFVRFNNGFTNLDHRSTNNVVFDAKDGGSFVYSTTSNQRFRVDPTKIESFVDAYKPGGGSWTAPSDRRLKKNINDYEIGLKEIMKIRPVSYEYNGKANTPVNKTYVGVIAQELKRVMPSMVESYTFEDPLKTVSEDYLAVNDNEITYMLINAVKELKELNDYKDNLLKELETRISYLEKNQNHTNQNHTANNEINSQNQKDITFKTSPNPFNDFINIEYAIPFKFNNASIKITNIKGELIKEIELDNISQTGTLLINDVSVSGTYIINLYIDSQLLGAEQIIKSN